MQPGGAVSVEEVEQLPDALILGMLIEIQEPVLIEIKRGIGYPAGVANLHARLAGEK